MLPADTVLNHEIPVIRKIIADETWLEGERRGCAVSSDDRVVRERVCTIVLKIGQELRDSIMRAMPVGSQLILPPAMERVEVPLDWEI